MSRLQILFDRTSEANVEYIGTAGANMATDAEQWTIKKITYDINAKPISIQDALASTPLGLVAWDDRLTLDYA